MKPTVINASNSKQGTPGRPTVIKPTAIPPSDPIPQPTVLKPTAMKATAPTVLEKPKAEVLHVKAPTGMPGVKRERIKVTVEDLQKLNSGTNPEILEEALRLIHVYNVATSKQNSVIVWGQDLQKEYADLINECLTLSRSPLITKVRQHISRIMEILESIDLKQVCGLEGGGGIIGRFLKQTSKKIDSIEELGEAQRELDQIIKILNHKIQELLDLRDKFEKISDGITKTGNKVEASSIAATFLADYLSQSNTPIAQSFLARSGSLLQTLGQIRGSNSIREIQIEQPLRLISTVQNVALVLMPSWIGSIVAVMTMLEGGSKPNITEVNIISDQMQQIVDQIK